MLIRKKLIKLTVVVPEQKAIIIGDYSDERAPRSRLNLIRMAVEKISEISVAVVNKQLIERVVRLGPVDFQHAAQVDFAVVDLSFASPSTWMMLGYLEGIKTPVLALLDRRDTGFFNADLDFLQSPAVHALALYDDSADIDNAVSLFIKGHKEKPNPPFPLVQDELPIVDYFENGLLEINFRGASVLLENRPLRLHTKEFMLLGLLARGMGTVLPYDYLTAGIWGKKKINMQLMRVTVNRLRSKLGETAANPRYVVTKYRLGLMMPNLDKST